MSATTHGRLLLAASALALLTAPGCVTLSQSARSHALGKGEVRACTAMGLSRPLGMDVEYARPANRDPEDPFVPIASALLLEAHGFYGLGEGVDVGLRVRLPVSPIGWQAGAKLESMVQLLSQREGKSPVSLAVAVGLDGFYRPWHAPYESSTRVHTPENAGAGDDEYSYDQGSLEPDGGFNLSYRGVQAELSLIAAYRTRPSFELFAGLRGGYLYLDAVQRYEPVDDGFATVEIEKKVREPVLGTMGGFNIEATMGERARFLIVPQLFATTLNVPGRGLQLQVGGALELGVRF